MTLPPSLRQELTDHAQKGGIFISLLLRYFVLKNNLLTIIFKMPIYKKKNIYTCETTALRINESRTQSGEREKERLLPVL